MSNVTGVILTYNEERYIEECIKSLSWTDEIIVLDSGSTDRTVEISQALGTFIYTRPFRDFADQRNAAIGMISSEWVFFLDADERVSPQLAAEVRAAVQDSEITGFWIPRHNYQIGRLILHAGLYPDYQLRLFRKDNGHYDTTQKVHERVVLNGTAGYFTNPIIHISCETWADFIRHQKRYAQMKAEMHFERGIKPTYHFIAGPVLEFLRRYLILQGFRDGIHGLYLSYVFAYYYLIMYVNLARLWKTRGLETSV